MTLQAPFTVVFILNILYYLYEPIALLGSGKSNMKTTFSGLITPNLGSITTFSYLNNANYRVAILPITPKSGKRRKVTMKNYI